MRTFACVLLFAAPVMADDSTIARLAGVSFTVANVDKARQFYTELLGLEETFVLEGPDGKIQSVFFKVNDDQFLEFSPGDVESFRFDRVTLLASDLRDVVALLKKSGVTPSAPTKGADGTQFITIRDPDR